MKTIRYLSKIIIIAIILQLIILPTISKAEDKSFTWDSIFQSGSNFIEQGKDGAIIKDKEDEAQQKESGVAQDVLDDEAI